MHFLNWSLKTSLSPLRLAHVLNWCKKALLVLLFPSNVSGVRPIMAPPFLVVWFVFPVVCTFADGSDILCILLSIGSRAANGSVLVSKLPPAAVCCTMACKRTGGCSCKGFFPLMVAM